MTRLVVAALEHTSAIAMAGLFDVIGKADRAWGALNGQAGRDTLFDLSLVSLDGAPVHYGGHVTVRADRAASEVSNANLVVIPGLDDDLDASFVRNAAWADWIARWHRDGAVVAASCSGAFLVAAAGLLDGRTATTHWLYANKLTRWFPAVRVHAERLLIDHGDVITSGGATTFLDLALYLVERYGGPARANAAARVLLIDGARTSQLPYVAIGGADRDHDDPLLHLAQTLIDDGLAGGPRVDEIARRVGLSPRSLSRRFQDGLGRSPQAYIRRRRIERAQRLLETTELPIDTVRHRIGYRDQTAFRRAFRHHTGLTPSAYRSRYGWTRHRAIDPAAYTTTDPTSA